MIGDLPLSHELASKITAWRKEIDAVLHGEDDRLIIVVGPCSVHDTKAALEYARALKPMAEKYSGELIVVMRVYFEKPRTTVGWKGLINDPDLDGTYNINKGLRIAREFLLQVNELGLPVGTEFLDTISPQYTSDLVCWGAIGARTTESQVHRELASGLSCAMGFKNGTQGSIQVAIDAVQSSSNPHCFLGVNEWGNASIVITKGNPSCHIILRGGSDGTNFDKSAVDKSLALLRKGGMAETSIMIDCSHGNSSKKFENQPIVSANVATQVAAGEKGIIGLMIESNIVEGNQKLDQGKTDISKLVYGQSVTDACVNLDVTASMLDGLAKAVLARRALNKKA